MDTILFVCSFLIGLSGAWFAMTFADNIGFNDIPNGRSSHGKAIPKCGGIGILAAFVLASLFLSVPMSFLLASLVISLVSLWGGDKHLLSVKERLFAQFACSLVFLFFLFHSKQGSISLYFLCVPISVFIVGTSNFYNFMDGIDGIAGITGVVGFGLLAFYTHLSGAGQEYQALCLVLVAACLGFLCLNIPRARVFVGDVGSILLGFLFACMVVILAEDLTDFIVLAGFLAPFYLDELSTMVVRFRNGETLIVAHRKHVYQLLVNEGGIQHWKVALGYGLFQLVIGLSGIFCKTKGFLFVLFIYMAYSFMFIMFSIAVRIRLPVNEN